MSEWINCKERMPPSLNKAYLVWYPGNKCIYTAYVDCEEKCWYYFANSVEQVDEKVTHWCELPPPPVENKE